MQIADWDKNLLVGWSEFTSHVVVYLLFTPLENIICSLLLPCLNKPRDRDDYSISIYRVNYLRNIQIKSLPPLIKILNQLLCFIKNISLVPYSKSSVIGPSQHHLSYKSSPQLMQVFSNPLSFSIFLKCIFPKTLFIKLPILISLNVLPIHPSNHPSRLPSINHLLKVDSTWYCRWEVTWKEKNVDQFSTWLRSSWRGQELGINNLVMRSVVDLKFVFRARMAHGIILA